jgi:predicted Zn-dependent protease
MTRTLTSYLPRVLTGLCALLAVSMLSAWQPAHASTRTVQTRRPPLVVVRGLGPVSSETLRLACRTLLQGYPIRCEVRPRRSLFEVMSSWDPHRNQLDARAALELLYRDRAEDALVEIDITAVDIYEEDKPWVFGLASLTDRIAIVSLARIDDDQVRLPRRLGKLVLHETGHALGLHHHDDETCVMRQDPTVAALDTAPDAPCDRCHRRLHRNAHDLARPGQLELDRARSHLVRGEDELARQYFVSMLWNEGFDSDLLSAFGLAFFEARRFNEAISVLRYVVKRDPDHAQAHVNLGLAYQMRARSGDRALAVDHLERALELRPSWDLVAEHLANLQPPRSAQGPQ